MTADNAVKSPEPREQALGILGKSLSLTEGGGWLTRVKLWCLGDGDKVTE